ncbi:asparagine synthase (glutamine-hydrolyzing) [bacterium]|nr:asparagine synthase (glutamine-hydrolyzing) [bacterium]
MCGICGIVNFNGKAAEEPSVRKMMSVMKHRGPDDEGVFSEGNSVLGFVRLSILDLSRAGHQPMESDGGRYVTVFNGEIFNYIELREELSGKGYRFRTGTDTEVLLAAWSEWGEECLDRLNGMWAFVIFDRKTRTSFAARDRYGIKPFYYYSDSEKFIFASEINPILAVLGSYPGVNDQAVFDFLVFNRTDHNETTFYHGIRRLPHGCSAIINEAGFKVKRWYRLADQLNPDKAFESPAEFLDLLTDSVSLRLRSDVPVGVCLSGGLDSSAIVSLLTNRFGLQEINTFSAVYERGQHGDEYEYIAEYRDSVANMHFTTPDAGSLLRDLPDFTRIHAEPVPNSGVYAQYKVMELARDRVVVTLDGQGADEIMAGYHYFFGIRFKDLAKRFRLYSLSSEVLQYLLKHRSFYGIKTMLYYMLPESLKTTARAREKGYLKRDFYETFRHGSTVSHDLYSAGSLTDSLVDHFEHKMEHLLKWEDLNSMRFSLEARVPFLDHRLVERALSTSADFIIRNGMTKSLMREALMGVVPEKIRMRRDKTGFGTPQDQWFKDPGLQEYIRSAISPDSLIAQKFIEPGAAERIFKRYCNGGKGMERELWKWISLESWYRGLTRS